MSKHNFNGVDGFSDKDYIKLKKSYNKTKNSVLQTHFMMAH